jgi:squalene synthase HpnC
VASRFVPEHLRRHVFATYAFARTADDIADEPAWAGRRAAALDQYEDLLLRAFHGEAEHPLFIALADTVDRRGIPVTPLQDLLTAFRMDLTVRRYSTFEALRGYTRYSAEPVGQLLLYIFDYRDPALHNYANDIAAALEITHFLQDLPVDLLRDRLYIPEEDLHHFGVSEDELRAGRCTQATRDMMRFEVARARALFQRGRPLTDRLGRDLGFELNLIWQGGVTILDKIDAADGDVLSRRPRIGTLDKVRMVTRSAARRWPGLRLGD